MAQEERTQQIYTSKARYLKPSKGIALPGLFLLLLFAVFLIPSISLAGGTPNMTVTSTVPTNGATGVTLDSNVTINFDYNLNCSTVNTSNITSTSPGWAFSSCSGMQAVFSTSGQANSTSYDVVVSKNVLSDPDGYTLKTPYSFSYTTEAGATTTTSTSTTSTSTTSTTTTTSTSTTTTTTVPGTTTTTTTSTSTTTTTTVPGTTTTTTTSTSTTTTTTAPGTTTTTVPATTTTTTVPADTTPPSFGGVTTATDNASGGAVVLTWTAATDDTPPITYNIYYATADNGQNFGAAPQATTSNSTGYLVTGLTNTVEYWFVVRAEDSLGNETTHTADLNATPTAYTGGGDTTPPTFNGLTSATGAASAVNLVWSAASEASTGNSTPIIYNIYWSYTSGGQNFANGPQATTSNSTGETITGLINGQIYYFVVRAQDWAGNETPVGEDVEKSATPTGGTAPFFVDATTNIGCENRNPSLHQGSWSNAASDITCVINRNNGATKPYTVVVRYHASNVYSFDLEPGITLKAEDYLNLGRPKISGPINFADGLGSTQTVFDGFEVTGSPASRTQGTGACGSGGTDFDNDFIIRNNIFQGSDKPGIKHDGGCPTILNNEIRNVGRTGIRIYSPAGLSNQAMIIKGNYIHNNGSSGSATNSGKAYANVNFQTSGDNRYVIIQDNLIENAVMAGGIGIEPTDDNIYITGNEITTNARGGIRIGTNIAISGSYTGQITISGEPNFTFGGKSYSDGAPNKIHTNAFGGITTGVPMPNGIGIIRNEIYNNTWGGIHTGWWEPTYGFYTWPGTYGDVVVTIRKNKVYGNGTDTANAGGGIDVRHASGTIENNLVYDNKYAGIRVGLGVTYGTGMTIRHNTVVDNGRGGIVYHDDANNCYSCSTGAIPYPPKTIVRDNIITDNGYAALRGINFPNTDGVWERDYNILYNNNNFGSPETGPGDCSTATKVAICKIKQYGGFWGFNMDPNDIMADPFYKDYANNDFRLLEISPGYQSASDSGDRGAWGGSYPIDW